MLWFFMNEKQKRFERVNYIADAFFDHCCEKLTGNTEIIKRKKGIFIKNSENFLEVLVRIFDLKNIVIETKIGFYNNSFSFKIQKFSDQQIIEKILKEELSATKISYEIDRTRQIKSNFELNLNYFVYNFGDNIGSSVKSVEVLTSLVTSYYATIVKSCPSTFKVNDSKTEYECYLRVELYNGFLQERIFLVVLCKVYFRELGDLEFKFFLQDIENNTIVEISPAKKENLLNIFGQGWIMKKYFFENPKYFENKGLFRQTFYDCLNDFIEKINENRLLVPSVKGYIFAPYIPRLDK